MRIIKKQSRIFHAAFMIIILSVLLLVAGCGDGDKAPAPEIDLDPFIEMGMSADCADGKNRLFLIDGQLVFWDREGDCPDNAYSYTLFADTIDNVLCEEYDSVGGPVKNCQNDFYSEMFDTIIANLDMPDLGIGNEYTVEEILF